MLRNNSTNFSSPGRDALYTLSNGYWQVWDPLAGLMKSRNGVTHTLSGPMISIGALELTCPLSRLGIGPAPCCGLIKGWPNRWSVPH